ncbi:hypothetical protein [Bordetella tumulicola]|uniref:hypothetical protein n=1 Tax=Bordetella tumulicola TaxID=1649133 RepID=UPI0039EDFEAB
MAETLVSWLVWMMDKVWPFPVFIIALVLIILLVSRLMGVPSSSTPLLVVVCVLMIGIPFGTPVLFMFGHYVTAPLIYHYGVPGQAVVVSVKDTGNIHNNQSVERYSVMLQKADGERIETHFDSSNFNVYPSRGQVRYPAVGQPFEVHYLARQPQNFVILLEGNSPYAKQQR